MATPDDDGGFRLAGKLFLNADILRRNLTPDEEQNFVNTVASALAEIYKTAPEVCGSAQVQVLRRGGIWGGDGSRSLSRHDLWEMELFVSPVEVLETL